MFQFNLSIKAYFLCLLALVLVIACGSCTDNSLSVAETTVTGLAQQFWDQPEVRPNFLESIDVEGKNQLCAAILQSRIWETGDEADKLSSQIKDSSAILVDNKSVNLDFKEIATLSSISDAEGKITGSFGGPLSVCFDINGVTQGLHLVKFTFKSTSTKQYSYTWAFQVADTNGSIVARVPKAICEFTCEAVIQ